MAHSTNRVHLLWAYEEQEPQVTKPLSLPITIGRDKKNAIVLNGNQVSRAHARIEAAGNQVSLQDAGSTNGIRVNNQRVTAALLGDGDQFQIASFNFTIKLSQGHRGIRKDLVQCSNTECGKPIPARASCCRHCGYFASGAHTVYTR